jgi:PAS domain S-box-containing protein
MDAEARVFVKLTARNRIVISGGAVGAYALAFVLLHPVLGDAILPLTVVPILVASWLGGTRGALAVAPGIILVDLALFAVVGNPAGMFSPISLVGHAVILVAALVTGRFSELNADQRRYLAERTELIEELRESERRYRSLFEQAGDAVFIVGITEGGGAEFLDCNQGTLTLFGCEAPREIVGRSPADFSPERQPDGERSEEKIAAIARAALEGAAQVFEWQHRRRDGSLFWVEVSLAPVALGPQPALQAIVRNISDRKIAEAERAMVEKQMRQAQKMEALGVLAGGVAHEFNNLLVPILGHVDLLKAREIRSPQDQQQQLDVIEKAALRATELVRKMMAYGRQSLSERAPVQLSDTVNEVVELIELTLPESVNVRAAVEERLPPVWGTSSELVQVLLNLCVNASHAMPDGGDLTIRAQEAGHLSFETSAGSRVEGDFLSLSVEDTGSGIAEDVMARMFDPFFTTKEVGQGSGLGLSVVQGIVEQHGGTVRVSSQLGEGSRFEIVLPVARTVDPVGEANHRAPRRHGSGRVLVVDDDAMVLDLTSQMLQFLGYDVTRTGDAQDAVGRFRAEPHGYDLVIADYGMPGMNGQECAAAIREVREDIPIIICSGYADVLARPDAASWNVDFLLTKPFQIRDLSAAVERVLQGRVEDRGSGGPG